MKLLRAFSLSLFLVAGSAALSQVQQFGMEKWWITAIAAEQGDVLGGWSGTLANQVFAATKTDGLFQANVSRSPAQWTPIGPFRDATIDIPAITVQHWGAGPRDGLHVFASQRYAGGSAGQPVLWRATLDNFEIIPPDWERADSGVTDVDTGIVIYSLAAYYYTGHTAPQPVLAGTGTGAWQGSAGGVYWTASVFNDPLGVKVNAIDVSPKWFGAHAWAAGRSGVMPAAFSSNDQGLNWKSHRLPALIEGEASAVAIAPGTRDTVYVALNNTIHRSMDGGATWVQCNAIRNNRFTALACDPENPSHVYAGGAPDFVLMRSTDYGVSWSSIAPVDGTPAGITCMTVAIMDSLPMGRLPREGLFIGTAGSGVWVFDMMLGQVGVDDPAQPTSASLRIWPNPARDAVTIEFESGGSGAITVDVLDMLGRVVSTSVHMALQGRAHITTGLSEVLPGSYVVRCSDGAGVRRSSLVVVR
jgi:hypothetical protein